MKWSKLKSAVEGRLADALRGQIKFNVTSYGPGQSYFMRRAWITLDKEELFNFSTVEWYMEHYKLRSEIREIDQSHDIMGSKQNEKFSRAHDEATAIMKKKGIYSCGDFYDALEAYLNMSIEEAISSSNPIIKSLGILDKRFGKRRLEKIEISANDHPMVRKFYEIRYEAEGLENYEQ